MNEEKVIVLAKIPVKHEYLEEVKALCAETLKSTLEEIGCKAFYQTFQKDEPGTLVFFEVFTSKKALDFHLEAAYTKVFFDEISNKLSGKPESYILAEL